jgi:TolB-like protein
MASLISGYAYDIFISYRQKDNKGDMWVSEFVEALKTELESTFKEEISVYFDINPSDYLLETYDVDESLKDKLKCLVFIPIISRTYCDPKSFAWEHEFKAFVEQASKDQFGLKIKLPNGNVASRVLSIIIYDLDSEDIKLCESVLGGVLRGVEFIYKSAGVNRPLRSNEDHPVDNLSKTYYRDQINKVANTVKEIITSLKKQSQHKEIVTTQRFKTQHVTPKNQKIRIISGTLMLLILIILGYFFIPKLFKSSEPVEKTIAVLPFRNLSNDTTQVYFCDGFMEEILNNLQLVKSFTIRSRTSSDQYRNTKKSVITIGKELNVNYLVEGSVAREGDVLKIWIQLIDSKADKHLWSSEYTREMKQIFSLQNEIAEEIVIRLKTVLSPEDIDQIQKSPTKNLEAYDLYLLGMHYYKNYSHDVDFWKAIEYFQRAIEIDSTFALSYAGLADVYYSLINFGLVAPNNAYPKVKEYATKALELNEELENAHCSMGKVKLFFDYDPPGADKEFVRAIEINPNSSIAHITYASFLSLIGKHDEAKSHADYALELDPLSKITKLDRINILYSAGFQNEA